MLVAVHPQQNLKFSRQYRNWTSTEWQQVAFSDESLLILYRTDELWHIRHQTYESKYPTTIAEKVQTVGGSIMVS